MILRVPIFRNNRNLIHEPKPIHEGRSLGMKEKLKVVNTKGRGLN